jgi:superoxide reductase
MPKIFGPVETTSLEKDIQKDYYDRHTPHVICEDETTSGEWFRVKIKMGTQYFHPSEPDHFIGFIQLWNRETLLAETTFTHAAFGGKPVQPEVDFFIVPAVSMHLTAMTYCTKHGLWQSDIKYVKVKDAPRV